MKRNTIDDFWSKVHKTLDGCWEWAAYKSSYPNKKCDHDYGKFKYLGKTYLAHRFSYCISNNIPIDDLSKYDHIIHTCDNPSCVNPKHLVLGNNLLNMRDKVSKERQSRYESHGRSKLTRELVKEIRDLYLSGISNKELSKMYKVNSGTISKVVRNITWII